MKPSNVRAEAAKVLVSLLSQRGSLASLSDFRGNEDQALLREMCFGTCRWYYQLNALLGLLLSKPLKTKDLDIHCLLLIGLYQLHRLRVPEYAVVNETVSAALALKKPWARGLINAVLREFLRQQTDLEARLSDPAAIHAHPAWLIKRLRQAWPAQWEAMLTANNLHPPMTLRVNSRRISRSDYLALLAEEGIAAHPGRLTESAIYLEVPLPVQKLPGFSEGLLSIQDEASQLIPGLLEMENGSRVLDACAAPGGKTCHLLEDGRPAHMLALDIEERRLDRISQNLERLSLQAELKAADASDPAAWWDGQPFDRILLDAPCSATGIIRRQPDIKILRRASDIPRMTALQEKLLTALWNCLTPGGMLLYSTCSVLPEENADLITRFLASHPDAKEQAISANWGVQCSLGRQLLPQDDAPDGFYFARLRKAQ